MKTIQACLLCLALLAHLSHGAALARAQESRLVIEAGATNSVTAVAFSPDGRFLASGNANGTVKLWNLITGRRNRTLGARAQAVNAVAFSPDGNLVAAAGEDKTIRVWETAAGRETKSFAHTSRAVSVAFGDGGKLLAAGGAGGALKLWDVAAGRELRALAGHAGEVFGVAFAWDGKTLASASADSLRVWDAATGGDARTFKSASEPFNAFALSADGRYLAGCAGGRAIRIWDAADSRLLHTLAGQADGVSSLAFGAGGTFASGGAGGTIKVWRVGLSAAEMRSFGTQGAPIRSLSFSTDAKLLASADGGAATVLWDAGAGRESASLVAPDEREWIVFTPAGHYDGTAGGMRHVSLVQAGQSIQIDAFFEQLYTPKLLAQIVHFSRRGAGGYDPDAVGRGRAGAAVSRPPGAGSTQREQAPLPKTGATAGAGATATAAGPRAPSPPASQGVFGTLHAPRRVGLDTAGVVRLPPHVRVEVPARAAAPTLKQQPERPAGGAGPESRTRGIGGEADAAAATTLKVTVTDQGGGIDEIRVYRNDKLVIEDKLGGEGARGLSVGAAGAVVARDYRVELAPGQNVFRAVALNRDRTESSPAEVRVGGAAAQATAALHLLAVGLNDYKNPRYSLNYGRADAQAFADEVERRGRAIFKRIDKHVLLDAQATREGIAAAFERIAAAAEPGDAFVFFYAGHGVMSEGGADSPPEFHLAPHDLTQLYGNDEMLASRGVAASLLREWCRKIPAQKQLIVLDACQAGGAVETFAALRGVSEEKAIMQLARSVGIIVLAATGSEQMAAEFKKLGHGAFTYALLQGLSGQADGGSQPDGKITVKELEAYLNDVLPELTRQHRGTPQFPNSYARGQDFPLGVK